MATPARLTDSGTHSIKKCFRRLRDPRRKHLRRHQLLDMIAIALCAVLCGANDWEEVVTFGKSRREWLQRFLGLPNGIPSHDTFERVFDRLDPVAFQACFQEWITAWCGVLKMPHVAIDGKTLRSSGSSKLGALHVVSAWATANHLILGEVAVDEKSNEITAIPKLVALLDLKGALVTIDAMGCQKAIAQAILDKKAHYLLVVKDNQPHLLEDIQRCLEPALEGRLPGVKTDCYEQQNQGHGRHEYRRTTIVVDPPGLRDQALWPGLCVIGMCYSERTVQGKTSEEARYFIGSKRAGAKTYAEGLRNHWGIENGLHWHMDLTFGEDDSRIKKRGGAEIFAVLRRIALSMLKQHPSKLSVKCKRLAAALDSGFLEEILVGGATSGKL